MASTKTTAIVALLNERECTVQLAWTTPAASQLEAVGGIRPMQPHAYTVEPLRPGLNFVPASSLEAAGGPDKLPDKVTLEDPSALRGRVAMDAIKASALPALRRWLANEKQARPGDPKTDHRAEIRKALEERIAELESKRAAA